jgi:putative oxidoreductase
MALGITVLRALVGALFLGHGLQKLAGKFGGAGLEATAEGFEQIGLKPGKRHATAAAVSETAGGALLATGLLTPLGATLIHGTMTTAIDKVHAAKGPWVTDGGFEYNAVLMAAAFAVAAAGPGPLSLDRLLGTERSGAAIALASLGAGVGGAIAVDRLFNDAHKEAAAAA